MFSIVSPEARVPVDAFHRAALEAGGTDHGAPGVRPHYHANYYGVVGKGWVGCSLSQLRPCPAAPR
jgi:hypothetical protein